MGKCINLGDEWCFFWKKSLVVNRGGSGKIAVGESVAENHLPGMYYVSEQEMGRDLQQNIQEGLPGALVTD